jgi:hypothetical protein
MSIALAARCLLSVIVAILFSATEALAGAPKIPEAFHGAWSTQIESCGKDSDGNYFIGANTIEAWEVSWDIVQLTTKARGELSIRATHKEYENNVPVIIALKKSDKDRVRFEECDIQHKSCWQIDLRRCPR